ncbi:MAG: LapA family protein [Lactococcus raffinolactis]|jgi:lipopolysaccharide assembly protein A|nr:LapA family protein [Lactococcus raffinolactis]MBP6300392.1 LapA family protein [Lactococcus sp.]MBR2541359.1 LapA family protein [Lactococcus sp.]MDG4962508.1 LapA family protein [Lactococcus raffinolactis]MDN5468613.1 LapA family protein [Lactococcus raffinolactis]MDN5472969.1 LapA family protein [Lactococcus raffinolactis]
MEKFKKIATPKRILALIILILVLIFAFQNLNTVSLNLVFFSLNMPLLVLIVALYVLGVITGWSVKRNDIKQIVNKAQDETKKEIKDLQEQIKDIN